MDICWLVFFLAIGACVGSFLNVVIYRLPRGESIVFPASHCPSCGRAIKWYDNIPLVSWLALRARCRFCKAQISPRYILVEAATAILVGGLYAWYYLLNARQGAGDFPHPPGRCSSPTPRCCAGCWSAPWWTWSGGSSRWRSAGWSRRSGMVSAAAAPHPFCRSSRPSWAAWPWRRRRG